MSREMVHSYLQIESLAPDAINAWLPLSQTYPGISKEGVDANDEKVWLAYVAYLNASRNETLRLTRVTVTKIIEVISSE